MRSFKKVEVMISSKIKRQYVLGLEKIKLYEKEKLKSQKKRDDIRKKLYVKTNEKPANTPKPKSPEGINLIGKSLQSSLINHVNAAPLVQFKSDS